MAGDRITARQKIEKLVSFFSENIYQFKSLSFNETQARQQLIDPFFEAFGWDVHNRLMQPLFRQEVVPESRMKSSVTKEVREQEPLFPKKDTLGKDHKEYASILDYIAEDEYKVNSKEAVKKPDYRFRIGGQTKFFVEAKKPCVDLAKSQSSIFQVKRYGFSGRVPLAVLTDFEEFRAFDCTQRPAFEKPKLGIIKDFDLVYKNYLDQFDRLYDTFSHDAVAGGSLEALTKKMMQKRTGDFALDREFLEDLSKWREELARDIAKHPKNRRLLNDYTLNEAVQRILDRIVFIRVCEDREIEVENTLLAVLRMWKERHGLSLYSLLNDLFKQRRALYNGLLFSPHQCEELEVGNEVLIKILQNLNYPFSPYHFNEIGVEILGSIYEKFLGKTIHLAPKNIIIKEKPEVRKAGGVYYTPQYIVKYIVDNTLGKLLYEEKQGTGLRGQGIEGGEHGAAIVQGVGGVETVDDVSGGNLQTHGNSTEEGTIWPDQSNAEGGGINSGEHSGGLRTDASGGLSPSPFNSAGIVGGIGNASGNFNQTDVSYGNANNNSALAGTGNGQNVNTANSISKSPLKSFPCTLTPKLSPKQAAKLKIIDIACGSGSFLLGAFQKLIDYHIEWYTAHPEDIKTENNVPDACKDTNGNYHLSPRKKRDILVNNIYGVDIDRQAVEVTQMSLYLKVLEGENAETLNPQMTLALKEVYLPAMTNNIKCGNSLIGTDFTSQGEMFDEETRRKVNPFDWEMEFPEILGDLPKVQSDSHRPSEGSRGFDVVIGNPPYIGFHGFEESKEYLQNKYVTAKGKFDIYVPFIEKGMETLKANGFLSYICPVNFTKREHGKGLRKFILNNSQIEQICDFEDEQIFEGATNYTGIFVFKNSLPDKKHVFNYKRRKLDDIGFKVQQSALDESTWVFRDDASSLMVRRVKSVPFMRLDEIASAISEGIVTGQNEVFHVPRSTVNIIKLEKGIIRNCLRGSEVRRYYHEHPNDVILYPYHFVGNRTIAYNPKEMQSFKKALTYLESQKKKLAGRDYFDRSSKQWYELWNQRDIRNLETSKIVVAEISDSARFTITDANSFYGDTVCGIILKDATEANYFYVLALLNSKLLDFYFKRTTVPKANGYFIYKTMFLKELPIRTIDFNNPAEKKMHDDLVSLVEKMLELNKQLQKSHFDSEKEPIERQIAATDKRIDELVYRLYDLTPEEIAIVEGKE